MSKYDWEYYNNNDQAWDRLALKFYANVFKKIINKNSNNKIKKVLEYWSWIGHLCKRLTNDIECYAYDISEYALTQVKINAPKAIIIENINEIGNNSLDGIISLHVLEHIPNPSEVIKVFYSMLKYNWVLFFVIPNPEWFGHILKWKKWFGFRDKTHVSLLLKKEWLAMLTSEWFEIKSVKGDWLWDVPYLNYVPDFIQKLIFFPPAFIQVLFNKIFLPTFFGECLIISAVKK